MFCYGSGALQNLNATGQSMIPNNPRRPGLRQSVRQAPPEMDIEQTPTGSFSKEGHSRNFGTNIANHMSRNALAKPLGTKTSKNSSRRTYRKESQDSIIQLAPTIRRSQTSLYEQSIHDVLQEKQTAQHSHYDFLGWQSEIDEPMRCTLIGWLTEVCNEFTLKNETLFMCLSLVDRCLRFENVSKNRFQLLGVSALFIACKYEEIYPPHINKFVGISGGSYTKQQVFEMESHIILRLDFKLISCTSLCFLDMRCLQIAQNSPVFPKLPQVRALAEFLLMLATVDYKMCWHRPSNLALAALCLSVSLGRGRVVEPHQLGMVGARQEEQRICFAQLYEIYENRSEGRFGCVRKRMVKHELYDPALY